MSQKMFATIVWATDGSSGVGDCLTTVRDLCRLQGSSLRIVHIARDDLGNEVIAELKTETQALRRDGIDASLHVTRGATGSPAPHILDVARAVHADLLVVSGAQFAAPADGRCGGVTRQLLADGVCPVLVVPATGRLAGRQPAGPAGPEGLAAVA